MISFLLSAHLRRDARCVEVWQDGDMIGVIYPTEAGVRIVSKHFTEEANIARVDRLFPRAVEIFIREPKRV